MEWFNEVFDLAAVASGAGLLGGAAGTGIAVVFSGVIMKFLARIAVTAIMTGVGYLALLNWLGFEIIPPEDLTIPSIPGIERSDTGETAPRDFGGIFTPQMLPNGQVVVPGTDTPVDEDTVVVEAEAAEEIRNPRRAYGVRSPFRRAAQDN